MALLEDAGLGPEQPGDRALAFPCRNAPVDVLLVRAADIPEYVQDGVVDCGITGLDLVRERGAACRGAAALGFGSCRLEAAVPAESSYERLEDLAGLRGRDGLPAPGARADAGARVELVEITGSVEVAPRLGLADAIVDLVSSGTRCGRTACGRSARCSRRRRCWSAREGAGRVGARLDDARRRRGARAPLPDAERAGREIERVCGLIGSRSPSVLPLAEAGMVAVHALVPAEGRLAAAARLEEAGASSILILPVERMTR